jgi:hypothetical protein
MKTKNWDALYQMNNELICIAQKLTTPQRRKALKDLEEALTTVCRINKQILDDELKNFPKPPAFSNS